MTKAMKIAKKIFTITALGAVICGGLISPKASASSPRFNFLPGDREFTVAKTQAMPSYSDPVNASVDDKVTVAIYYHNGILNSTAINTRVRVQLPTVSSDHQIIRTTLSADNADSITDTVVNGQVVGSPDLTINLNQAAEVHYVPGSTLWYPDIAGNPNETGVVLPDDIITANGVSLGNIDGCWNHAGYVLFDVVFNQRAELQTEKWVALFGGDNQWVKENTAQPGDTLRYQIYFNNNGNMTARNTRVVDTLPDGVTYEPGSVYKRVGDANNNDNDVLIPDNLIGFNGNTLTIPLGDVGPGQINSGYVYMRVRVNNLPVGVYSLVNNEQLQADNAPSVSASALTHVTVNPVLNPDVKILKEVVNVTQGGTSWVRENTAKPGDRLEYRLTVYNQGNTPANDVSVKDTLPANVSYVAGTTKIYTTDPNSGHTIPDGIVDGGVNIGTVVNGVPNGNRYLTFDVIVSSSMPAGNTDLINNADVFVAGVHVDHSTATTTVTSEIGLIITKEVWNPTLGQWVTRLEGVNPGDVVTYRILVRNTGNSTVNNPLIKDALPDMVDYVLGSTRMDGSVHVDDAWIVSGEGLLIANITPGNYKTITFQVKVASCPPGGIYTLTNTASVTADGVANKTASADIIVTAGAPNLPQ